MSNPNTQQLRFGPDDLPPWPQYDDSERTALIRALEQGQWWRVTGAEVEAFEREFAAYTGAPHALAVVNGTIAIEIALRIHGIGPGDEVIVPAFTFISTSLAVQNVGAVPVPADISGHDYCLTVEAAEAALTSRTRALLPVHMAGHPADLEGLAALAERHGLVLVQDAAHAQGTVRGGQPVGAHPSIACYSFQNGKLMTAGEGGALTFPDEQSYETAYLMHTCGRPRGDVTYQHVTGGTNARVSEFTAAVLRSQLARLGEQTRTRQRGADLLDSLFAADPRLESQGRDPRVDRNPHYMYLLTLDAARYGPAQRDEYVERLKARGVPACVNFPPVYRTRAFALGPVPDLGGEDLAKRCPESERVCGNGLWIHHRVLLAEPEVLERLAAVVVDVLDEMDRDR